MYFFMASCIPRPSDLKACPQVEKVQEKKSPGKMSFEVNTTDLKMKCQVYENLGNLKNYICINLSVVLGSRRQLRGSF